MRMGRSFEAVATELDRQVKVRRDHILSTTDISVTGRNNGITINHADMGEMFLTAHTQKQMAADLQIPYTYWQRCGNDSPDLLAQNVQHWLGKTSKNKLVRTLDGGARAWLSDKYKRLDSYPLLETVYPHLVKAGMKVESVEVTGSRFYLKVRSPGRVIEPRVGDQLAFGLQISNSEVGAGPVRVSMFVYELRCANGMVIPISYGQEMTKRHLGRRLADTADLNATEQFDSAAFWKDLQDHVATTMEGSGFEEFCNQFIASDSDKIAPETTRENIVKRAAEQFTLTQDEQDRVLVHWDANESSRYGLIRAITRSAEDHPDYDRATELETLGGVLVDLGPREWTWLNQPVPVLVQ